VRKLALAACCLLIAGCLKSDDAPGPTEPLTIGPCSPFAEPDFVGGQEFSGANAFAHVLRLACDFSKDPPEGQYRVPGTKERIEAALYLEQTLRSAGWSATYQNFTGEDYQGLPKGSVGYFARNCAPEDVERVKRLEFSNVMGSVGNESPEYVFLAHYESQRRASRDNDSANRTLPVLGANDGLSGVGVLLELARVLKTTGSADRIRLLFVDGEDGFEDCHPLAGSIYYAQTMSRADQEALRAAVLLDMVGDQRPHFCYSHNSTRLRDDVKNAARDARAALLAEAHDCSGGLLDDHTSFMDSGLPAIDIIDYANGFPAQWNTRQDWPEKLSVETLAEVGRTLHRLSRDR